MTQLLDDEPESLANMATSEAVPPNVETSEPMNMVRTLHRLESLPILEADLLEDEEFEYPITPMPYDRTVRTRFILDGPLESLPIPKEDVLEARDEPE